MRIRRTFWRAFPELFQIHVQEAAIREMLERVRSDAEEHERWVSAAKESIEGSRVRFEAMEARLNEGSLSPEAAAEAHRVLQEVQQDRARAESLLSELLALDAENKRHMAEVDARINDTRSKKRIRRLVAILVTFAVVGVPGAVYLTLSLAEWLRPTNSVAAIPVASALVSCGFLVHVVRSQFRRLYAALEFGIAALCAHLAVMGLAEGMNERSAFQGVAAIYFVVRALDNYEAGRRSAMEKIDSAMRYAEESGITAQFSWMTSATRRPA